MSSGKTAILVFAVIAEAKRFNLVVFDVKFWLKKNFKFVTCMVMGCMIVIKRQPGIYLE